MGEAEVVVMKGEYSYIGVDGNEWKVSKLHLFDFFHCAKYLISGSMAMGGRYNAHFFLLYVSHCIVSMQNMSIDLQKVIW